MIYFNDVSIGDKIVVISKDGHEFAAFGDYLTITAKFPDGIVAGGVKILRNHFHNFAMVESEKSDLKKHPYAELMLEFAKDAMETDKPWKRWEFNVDSFQWETCSGIPKWAEHVQYRRKVPMIVVNAIEVPAPLSLESNLKIDLGYVAAPDALHFYYSIMPNERTIARCLERGLLHLSKENAIIHAKAMLGIKHEPGE